MNILQISNLFGDSIVRNQCIHLTDNFYMCDETYLKNSFKNDPDTVVFMIYSNNYYSIIEDQSINTELIHILRSYYTNPLSNGTSTYLFIETLDKIITENKDKTIIFSSSFLSNRMFNSVILYTMTKYYHMNEDENFSFIQSILQFYSDDKINCCLNEIITKKLKECDKNYNPNNITR